jgi:hypothetical protein
MLCCPLGGWLSVRTRLIWLLQLHRGAGAERQRK